jgi:hypothetical protein
MRKIGRLSRTKTVLKRNKIILGTERKEKKKE